MYYLEDILSLRQLRAGHIWTWVPTGSKTKNNCASEGKQQFTRPGQTGLQMAEGLQQNYLHIVSYRFSPKLLNVQKNRKTTDLNKVETCISSLWFIFNKIQAKNKFLFS
jgi:hypothetical protein